MRNPFSMAALLACAVTFGLPGDTQAGDPEAGKIRSYTCTWCHGIPGYKNVYPTYHVPKIGGQNEPYLVAALKAYRDGDRNHDTMELQAQALSDEDIADIAAYFASLNTE